MKRRRKTAACLGLGLVMILSLLLSFKTVQAADGWVNHVNGQMNLDTTYSYQFSTGDYYDNEYYFKVYEVNLPEEGVLSLYFEAEDKLYGYNWGSREKKYYFYPKDNIDNYLWYHEAVKLEYSSARGIYYGSVTAKLDKGAYYFVLCTHEKYIPTGTCSITLNYTPAISAPAISPSTRERAGFTANWSRVNLADGYELQYSKSKDFPDSSTETVQIEGGNKVSQTVSDLEEKASYYVRVRSKCTMDLDGVFKTYYSDWSDSDIVKTKALVDAPAKAKISSIKAKSKGFTITWGKVASATSYEVKYQQAGTVNKRTVTINSNSTTKYTASKLAKKAKYFVWIRSVKVATVNGQERTVYSGWSKAKTIKTK